MIKKSLLAFVFLLYSVCLLDSGYYFGYKEGLKDGTPPAQSMRDMFMSNKAEISKVCYTWWFKTPPLERKIK